MAWGASKMNAEFSKATQIDAPAARVTQDVPTAVYRRATSKRRYKMNDERDSFNIFLAWACALLFLMFFIGMFGK